MTNKNLENELTVFLIATEKEKNYNEALEALNNQTVSFQFKQILDVEPINEAFNEMLKQCNTPYFCQIDEDMILNSDAIETMYNQIKNVSPNVAMIRFKLLDKYLSKIIGSVIIYNNDISQNFYWENTPFSDLNRHEKIRNAGYDILTKDDVLGIHHPYWSKCAIFRKFAIRSEKVKALDIKDDIFLKSLISKLKTCLSELDLFALLGYCIGAFKKSQHEKDYSTLLMNEFKILNNIFGNNFNDNKCSYYEFITMEKNNLVRSLSKYINLEIVSSMEEIKQSKKPIIIWNGYTVLKNQHCSWKQKLINYCKENNRVYYIFERGSLPNCLFLDKHGFLNDSSSYNKENWKRELDYNQNNQIENFIKDFINDSSSLEKQQTENFESLNIDSNNKIAFVPFQVYNDTVMQLWADWVENQENYYQVINNLAKELPDWTFIVKNHPVQIAKRFPLFKSNLSNIVYADNVHYKDCIKNSDIVITINSSIGLQAMMWGKPVLILGEAFYQFDEINHKIKNYNDLKNYLQYQMYREPDFNLAKQFIYFLKFNFYTSAKLKKIGINSTNLEYIDKLIFESPYNNTKVITNFEKSQNINLTTLQEFLKILNHNEIYPCFIESSCLEVVKNKNIVNCKELFINVSLSNECMNDLKNAGFIINDNRIKKEDLNVYISYSENIKTKKWYCENFEIRVPFPVVQYLQYHYSENWRNRK